jgi:hypothetical protein
MVFIENFELATFVLWVLLLRTIAAYQNVEIKISTILISIKYYVRVNILYI